MMITSKRATSGEVDLEHEHVSVSHGTQPIDDVADAIVDDVRRKAGRPSLTGTPAASPRVSFRVTPEVRDRAAAVASAEGKTISELAREALEARVQGY